MASKIGKALGYSMDSNDNAYMHKKGLNDSDVDKTVGIGKTPSRDQSAAEGDSDSDMGEDTMPPMSEDMEPQDAGRTAEILAMKQFQRAATPEDAVSAMKNFLEACGMAGGSSY